MEDEKYLNYIRSLVAQNPGAYCQLELIKQLRAYGFNGSLGDPGFVFAKKVIKGLIESGELEMKTQEAERVLQILPSKKAFIKKPWIKNETNNN